MFKDIRVRAALRTLGLFGIAAVSGLVGVLFIQTYGIMAAVTLVAIALVFAMMGAVYDIMLLRLKHEKEYQELSASLDEKIPTE
jgi:hypothetical protein